MRLIPRDEKSFNWITFCDLADGEPKTEKFAVKFKLSDTATTFQKVFNYSLAGGIDGGEGSLSTEASSVMAKNSNTWKCPACYTSNEEFINKCITCGGDHIPKTSSGTCSACVLTSISMPVTSTPTANISCDIMMSNGASPPATTIAVAPLKPPIFAIGGNSQSSQSVFQFTAKPASDSGFLFSPSKFEFRMGTFDFNPPLKIDATSFPSFRVNTSSSGQSHHLRKDTDDAEVDSQAEEWLTASESEYLSSEPNSEDSEDENDGPSSHHEQYTGTSLSNTAGTSTASVNAVSDKQLEENKQTSRSSLQFRAKSLSGSGFLFPSPKFE